MDPILRTGIMYKGNAKDLQGGLCKSLMFTFIFRKFSRRLKLCQALCCISTPNKPFWDFWTFFNVDFSRAGDGTG